MTHARYAVLLLTTLVAFSSRAATSWRSFTAGSLIAETSAVAPGQTATIGFRITLEDQWHTYWINPGDSGSPLRLRFDLGPGVTVRRVLMPIPQRFETGPLITFGFAREVLLPIELDIAPNAKPDSNLHVAVEAEWLVCQDICIPATDRFDIDLPVRTLDEVKPSDHFNAFQRARARAPTARVPFPRFERDGAGRTLDLGRWPADRDFVDFFPFKGAGVTNEEPVVEARGRRLSLRLNAGPVPPAGPDRVGVVVTRLKASNQIEAWEYGSSGWTYEQRGADEPAPQLWWMVVSAFIGGLILNLMPCVFPILSIKMLSLLKLGTARPGQVRVQNGAYVLGVLLSFLGVAGVLAGLRAAGTQVGWGFQLQSPLFLTCLIWLFFALSLNLLGLFEIEWLGAGFGHRLTRFDGPLGSFFTGVLAVVVASPCTAPFMGVALGFGIAQPTPVLIAVFMSLGLGLAFPYVIFMIEPRWIAVLPKPGRWMNRVKQAMAFPLLATDLWLTWVLGQVRGPDAMVVSLAGCVALGAALWFSKFYRRSAATVALGLLAAGLIVVGSEKTYVASRDASDVWKPFSTSALEALRGQNVLVDVTADWCLTCQVNDRLVFRDAAVMKLLAEKKITLVRADWTQRNPEITRYLNRFSRVGVPFYVLYSAQHPNGLPLPELLTRAGLVERVRAEYP